MTYETIDWNVTDRVLTLTLNRPQKLNAFTVQMANELVSAFERVNDDDSVGVVVLTGAGAAFCAGMDLGEKSATGNVFGLNEQLSPSLADIKTRFDDPEIMQGVRDTGGRVSLAIYDSKKPVIAAINGVAVGVGATIPLAADIRLASSTAKIGFVFGRIGITPEACSTWFLPKLVGLSKALEWMYSADLIDAVAAQRAGLVSEVVEPDRLLLRAYELARKFIHERSPVSTALIRQMIYRNSTAPHPRLAHEIESLAMFYTSHGDGKEGVASFLEKRKPQFSHDAQTMPPFYPWWED
jgi:enoyl-CoA hydratase/carnithine racemase